MDKRRKIAVDARCLGEKFTSNRTYWQELLIALSGSQEFQPVLFADAPLDLPEQLRQLDRVTLAAPSSRIWSLHTFPRAAKECGAAVAHVQYSVSPFFRIPAVTTIHDVSYFVNPKWFSLRDRFLLRRSVPMAMRKASAVIAVSNTSKQEMVDLVGADPKKVFVTPLGVPSYISAKPREESRELVRNLCGGENPFILSVGTIQPRKNWRVLLQAAALVRKESIPKLELLITGEVRDNAEAVNSLLEELGSTGWIHLLGGVPQDALSYLYSAADVLMHPSLHEGFGLTPLEAFACGTPVVASTRGAIPEVAGDAAILVDSFDPKEWARAIVKAMDPAESLRLREAGAARAKEFSWERCAQLTEEAYRFALGGL